MTTERLYTPWRMKYVASNKRQEEDCVFCHKLSDDPERDQENYLLYRGKTAFAILNIYPYNTGHLMILPYQHVAKLSDMSQNDQFEIMTLISYFTDLLTELMKPDGFNIGLNIGRTAGAGIDGHLHVHIVPRWSGDSNFMAVIGETRVLPEELSTTYTRIISLLKEQPPI